jgi:hypothetical protein
MSGRFQKGRSGNPAGRPKARRPHVSAFDIIFDKTLTVTQNGIERELTVDEALQLQTYQAALKGSKMAVRVVLKMIEKREQGLKKAAPAASAAAGSAYVMEYDSDSAHEAMKLLNIASFEEAPEGIGRAHGRLKLETWATQAALSRPGRKRLTSKDVDEVKRYTRSPERLKWPKGVQA